MESEPRASWRSGKQRPNSARCVRSCRWDARSRLMCVEGAALPVRGHKHLLAAGLRGSSVHVLLATRRRWSKTGGVGADSSECRFRHPTRRPAAIGSTRTHPLCRAGSRKLAFLCISASAGARPAFLCKQDGCCACEDGARGLLPLALGSTCALDLVTRRRSIRSGCAGAKKLLLDSLA